MDKVYEQVGRLHCDNAILRAEFTKLLDVIDRMKTGELSIANFQRLPGDNWQIVTDSPTTPKED